ncbi:MAG: right-handed parallel beta-helix repeat-containing protein [Lewinella sp.]
MRTSLLLVSLLLLLFACEVDRDYLTGDSVELRFSVDTLTFDTVFTARGSATRVFKVYNDASDPVQIDRIRVAGETGVEFTFNADGTMGPEAEDVVIFAQDSIFVFVEAEVDPTQPEEVSPFIATDRLVFETGNFQHEVTLEAYGQNAFYLNGFNRGTLFQPICQDGTFTLPTDLPTVIYGSMVVDSCVLRILAGTRIYFHGGLQRDEQPGGLGIFNDGFIYTLPAGRIELLGTQEDPIILATDRLEEDFAESTGGYRGLVLGPLSRGNRIEYTEIRNSIIGVTVDSLAEVTITNSRITNSSGSAILSYQGDVTARNTLFHSNQSSSLQFIKGGNLLLEHCTIAGYGSTDPALSLSNCAPVPDENYCLQAPLRTTIRNSIIAGGSPSEIELFDVDERSSSETFDVQILNSVVRTDQRFLTGQDGLYEDFYTTICTDCYNLEGGDALFQSTRDDDYYPDSLSVARNLGVYLSELPLDLEGNDRDTESPDAGALEWQPAG